MTPETLYEAWVYLAASPLLGLTTTLVVYIVCDWLYQRSGQWPGLNPVMASIIVLVAPIEDHGHFLRNILRRRAVHPLFAGASDGRIGLSSVSATPKTEGTLGIHFRRHIVGRISVSALSGVWIAELLGAAGTTLLSLAPKSVTTPVGMGIAEKIGGLPSLTAGLVVLTGVIGAVIGPSLFRLLRIRSDIAKGIAMGTASHGIGTARALQLSEEMGAFSGLAMALSALITTFTLPVVLQYLSYY